MNKDFERFQKEVENWANKNEIGFVMPKFLDLFRIIEQKSMKAVFDFISDNQPKDLTVQCICGHEKWMIDKSDLAIFCEVKIQ